MHWNPAGTLPPVDCPLLIQVEGVAVKAYRPTFVEAKGDDLVFITEDKIEILGRFPWTYP